MPEPSGEQAEHADPPSRPSPESHDLATAMILAMKRFEAANRRLLRTLIGRPEAGETEAEPQDGDDPGASDETSARRE